MRFLYSVLLLALAASSAFADNLANGYFAGRSGDAVLTSEGANAVASFVDSKSSPFLRSSEVPSHLASQNYADIVSRVLGLGAVHMDYNPSYVSEDLFHRARATVMLSAWGVDADVASENNLSFLKSALQTSRVELDNSFEPIDEVSLLSTLASGQVPQEHGIVGRSWQQHGEMKHAYLSAGCSALGSNVADTLATTFQGRSLIISASSDAQLTLSTCVNDEITSSHPEWNTICLSYADSTFTAINENNKHDEAISLLAGSAVTQQDAIGLALRLLQPATSQISIGSLYDFSDASVQTFFTELKTLSELPDTLMKQEQLNSLVKDDVPDYFTLHFASLQLMMEKYGASSPQYKAATRLVDGAMKHIVKSFNDLYADRVLVSIVLIPSSLPSVTPDMHQQISTAVNGYTGSAHVYAHQMKSLSNLQEQLSTIAVSVKSTEHLKNARVSAVTDSPVTADDVNKYQIVLWLSIGLVFAIVAAVYSLAFMNFKKDTMIYGSFNPNWEDRKRR